MLALLPAPVLGKLNNETDFKLVVRKKKTFKVLKTLKV
jgi:hypothetical protein